MKGKFITVEGCEGVGKSTQIKLLKEYLEKNNIKAKFLREPGGTDISEKIRDILLSLQSRGMDSMTETALYEASRAQLLKDVILPTLDNGEMVVCDRYIDSTFAYQGVARNLGIEKLIKLHEIICNGVYPDLTIFLDLNPRDAFLRKGGADADDRLEQEGEYFHQCVYDGYIQSSKIFKDRFVLVDASASIEDTHKRIIDILKDKRII